MEKERFSGIEFDDAKDSLGSPTVLIGIYNANGDEISSTTERDFSTFTRRFEIFLSTRKKKEGPGIKEDGKWKKFHPSRRR